MEFTLQLGLHACAVCVYGHSPKQSCPGGHATKQTLRIKWVFAAIFVPELGVFTACQQRYWARTISNKLDEPKFEQEKTPSGTTNPYDIESYRIQSKSFSLIYGHYVAMSGLNVDLKDMHDGISRLTLTPPGTFHFAELGLFKDISGRDICDKSKSDILGKSLVIL